MKIIPVLTEKSLNLAQEGKYTFWVETSLTKNEIRSLINKVFNVHTKEVRTVNYKSGQRKNYRGRKVSIHGRKKAIVTLSKDEKIDLFEKKGKK
jgi:large subunit ribosomal protein L23